MGWVLFWITCGIASAYIASQKNKSGFLWFILGLIIGPLALIMVGLSPALPKDDGLPKPELRKCPFCAEDIKPEALLCKHCGKEVEPVAYVFETNRDIIAEYEKIVAQHGESLSVYGVRAELGNKGFSDADIAEVVRIKTSCVHRGEIEKAFDAIVKKEGGELSAGGMTVELKKLGFPDNQVDEIVRRRCYIPPGK